MPNDEFKRRRKKKPHKDIRYDEELRVSRHGARRARERLGLPKNAVKKNAERAMWEGVKREETYGPFRRYLDAMYYDYGTANNLRVYNRHIYIFCNEVLVTVLKIPYKYFDVADVIQRRKKARDKKVNKNRMPYTK